MALDKEDGIKLIDSVSSLLNKKDIPGDCFVLILGDSKENKLQIFSNINSKEEIDGILKSSLAHTPIE